MDLDNSPPADRFDSTDGDDGHVCARGQPDPLRPAPSLAHNRNKTTAPPGSPEPDGLGLKTTNTTGSSPHSQRTRRSSNRSSERGFTVEDITNDLDGGYDADTEVIHPQGCDEPDTDGESTMTVPTPVPRGSERNLADRLRSLSFDGKKKGHSRRKSSSLIRIAKRSRKRAYSEPPDSGAEAFDGESDPSGRAAKRFRAGGSPEIITAQMSPSPSRSTCSDMHIGDVGSSARPADADAMEVDNETP